MPSTTPSASRTSLSDRSQASASPADSRTRPPVAGSVASTVRAASTLPERRPGSVYRRNSPAACAGSPPLFPPRSPGRRLRRPDRSPVVAYRGPQAVAVQDLGISFHGLTRPRRNHGLAPVVHVKHELLGPRLGVAEHL